MYTCGNPCGPTAESESTHDDGAAGSTVEWIRRELGFEPDAAQRRVLSSTRPRVLLNCTRQWGKSTVTAAKAIHQAVTVDGSLTLVVSPSARQSSEFLRQAEEFARRLRIKRKRSEEHTSELQSRGL